jgi:hypothetical protein
MKSKRMFDVGPTGFQPNYFPVSPSALPAFYSRVGLPNVFRSFPASYFPAYYPANYPGKSIEKSKNIALNFCFF